MSLQFIAGGSGSGKTRYLYEKVIKESEEHPDIQYLFIVPEQYTMQTQKELVRLHPRHGLLNIDVLSFKRLAYRVFEDLGVQLPQVLDDMGKSMVIRKVAGKLKKELKLYGGHLEQPGFINQLKSQISELCQYGVSVEDLAMVEEETDRVLLKDKLGDLKTVYGGFKDYIESHYITAEEILDILCRKLPQWEPLKNSVILLDGYTGFTPVQYRLAELFMIHSREVICCVTADPREMLYKECTMQHLFYMGRHTVCRLRKMAEEHHIPVLKEVWCDNRPAWRFKESPQLDFLEQNLYRYNGKIWKNDPQDIQIFRGKNPAEETEYVCSCINEKVQKEGMRYRDLAVVTGDLASYGKEIAHRFDEAGIPYFLDDKKSILENPFIELIRAALDGVKDASYESIFRYLKTGFVYDETYSREEAQVLTDRMENYARALGIKGWKNWDMTWEKPCRGGERLSLEELNQYRQWMLEPLKVLRQAFKEENATISSVTTVLRQVLESMKLEEKLESFSNYFLERKEPGDENRAREYSQVYERVMELLERLEGLLGDEKADMKNYIQILDAGFEEIKIGVLPATADQVMIGDITRSRLESVKVLFFTGVNEGIVPQRKAGGSLLNDGDREVFKSLHMELAPTASCIQKFYLYLMLSKPSRQLVITYAAMNGQGKSCHPSSLIGEIRRLFPEMVPREKREEEWPVWTAEDGLKKLMAGLREAGDKNLEQLKEAQGTFLELFRRFYGQEEYRKLVEKLTDAAFFVYEDKGIGRAAARALYGQKLQGSVTRLEQFAACAYAHFLKYGLELMERQEYQLEAVDMGNLFHQSLDQCFEVIHENGMDWSNITEEERKELVKKCVDQVTSQYGNTIMSSSARNTYLAKRVERITDRTIWALAEQVKKGDFVPSGFEVSFSAIDNLKAMKIRLSEDEELLLKGRIDRLDLCEDEKHVYVKIIDYKSGNTSFDLAALYYGLQLQLVVYMNAAMELESRKHPDKEIVPAALLYYHIDDPTIETPVELTQEQINEEILTKLRMNGVVNSDPAVVERLDRFLQDKSKVIPVEKKKDGSFSARSGILSREELQVVSAYVDTKIRQIGREILDGKIAANPYEKGNEEACTYCAYKKVCGFDGSIPGYEKRQLEDLDKQTLMQRMQETTEA